MDNSEITLRAPVREPEAKKSRGGLQPLLSTVAFAVFMSPAIALGLLTFHDKVPGLSELLQPPSAQAADPALQSKEMPRIQDGQNQLLTKVPAPLPASDPDLATGEEFSVHVEKAKVTDPDPIIIYDEEHAASSPAPQSSKEFMDSSIARANAQRIQENPEQAKQLQQQIQNAKFEGLSLPSFSPTLKKPGFAILNDIGNINGLCILDCAPPQERGQ